MSADHRGEGYSPGFLALWVILPAAALAICFVWSPDGDPLIFVAFPALFLAGTVFPRELQRERFPRFSSLLALLLFLAPFFLAAGRLSAGGWRTGAIFLLVGLWLAIPWAVWKLRDWDKGFRTLYLFLFALLAVAPPFLAYLLRDFGGKTPAALSEISPFTLVFRLAEGRGYETGAALALPWILLVWAGYRREKQRREEAA